MRRPCGRGSSVVSLPSVILRCSDRSVSMKSRGGAGRSRLYLDVGLLSEPLHPVLVVPLKLLFQQPLAHAFPQLLRVVELPDLVQLEDVHAPFRPEGFADLADGHGAEYFLELFGDIALPDESEIAPAFGA